MITDGEDCSWPEDFPELRRLDGLLRCGICYEYLQTALMTPCSHNFCSVCIRKYMQYKTNCPACFVETVETQLRNNRALDELVGIVERLKKPLTAALHSSSNEPAPIVLTSSTSNLPITPTKTLVKNNHNTLHKTPQHLTSQLSVIDENSISNTDSLSPSLLTEESPIKVPSKPSRSLFDMLKSPNKNSTQLSSSSQNSSSSIFKEVSSSVKSPPLSVKKELPSTSSKSIASSFSQVKSTVTTLVPCPVCSVDIPERNINLHLDACLKNINRASVKPVHQQSSISHNRRKPLPKMVYRLMSERDLKRKLTELKLSSQGDRKTLEKRHQKYLVIYNAECDKIDPRPVADLIKQLEKEERDEVRANCKTWTSLQVDRKTDPKVIEEVQKKYLQENKQSFDSLIADMRRRKEEAKAKKKTFPEENKPSTSGCSSLNNHIPVPHDQIDTSAPPRIGENNHTSPLRHEEKIDTSTTYKLEDQILSSSSDKLEDKVLTSPSSRLEVTNPPSPIIFPRRHGSQRNISYESHEPKPQILYSSPSKNSVPFSSASSLTFESNHTETANLILTGRCLYSPEKSPLSTSKSTNGITIEISDDSNSTHFSDASSPGRHSSKNCSPKETLPRNFTETNVLTSSEEFCQIEKEAEPQNKVITFTEDSTDSESLFQQHRNIKGPSQTQKDSASRGKKRVRKKAPEPLSEPRRSVRKKARC